MKGYADHYGQLWQLGFDPVAKQFVHRLVGHPFLSARDPLESHLLTDLGIDPSALTAGRVKYESKNLPPIQEFLS